MQQVHPNNGLNRMSDYWERTLNGTDGARETIYLNNQEEADGVSLLGNDNKDTLQNTLDGVD